MPLYNPPASGGGEAVEVLQQSVTLSSAELLDLFDTPIQVVAAQGANKVVDVHRVAWVYDFGTTAYGGDDAGRPVVFYGDDPLTAVTNLPTGKFGGTSDVVHAEAAAMSHAPADCVNRAVKVGTDGAGEFEDGDGSLTVVVTYSVLDLS